MPRMDGVHFLQEATRISILMPTDARCSRLMRTPPPPSARHQSGKHSLFFHEALGSPNRNIFIRNWTICSMTGRLRIIPSIRESEYLGRDGRRVLMNCAIFWRATTSPTNGSTRKFPRATRRPSFCSTPWGKRPPAYSDRPFSRWDQAARMHPVAGGAKRLACARRRKLVSTIWQ